MSTFTKRYQFSSSDTDVSSITSTVNILKNNEYKITYYEIVSGASGTLTIPAQATINAGEFGASGNCVLSKIDGSNKPTFISPTTVGGKIVTSTLNTSTGAWVASEVYTDPSVALIYSIQIKAIYMVNLVYSRIIETVSYNNISTSGGFAANFTLTGTTTVTLPTTGTLYGTATGSITSAQMLASLSDETGSGAVVFANNPTLITPVLGAAKGTSLLLTPAAANILQVGAGAAPSFPRDIYIRRDGSGVVSGLNITNTNTAGYESIAFEESSTEAAFFSRFNSAISGNIPGTSIPLASNVRFQSGSIGQMPLVMLGTPVYGIAGSTAANLGFKQQTTGFRIDQIQNLHTNNTNAFTVNGKSFLGANTTATAILHLAAGTASASTAPLKFTSGTHLTTAEAGAVEYNGTNLFFTRTGTVREGVLTQSEVTTEVIVPDRSVTINIGGVTYKLLARA